jgi:hypothetical protein
MPNKLRMCGIEIIDAEQRLLPRVAKRGTGSFWPASAYVIGPPLLSSAAARFLKPCGSAE